MKSPVRGLSPSDSEEVLDNTPLLQGAPQAEAGEQRSRPGAWGGRRSRSECRQSTRALSRWGQSCLGRGSLGLGSGAQGEPRREGTRETGDYSGPHLPPACPGAQKPLRGPEAGGGRLEWDLGKCSPVGPGRGAAGRLAVFGSMEPGTPWKNGLGEILQTDRQRAGQSRWLSLPITARFPQLPARQDVIW